VQAKLKDLGIPTAVHYPTPMPHQPAYKDIGRIHESIAIAEDSAKKVLSLPMYPDAKEEHLQTTVDAVKSIF
jgi:UDP-2-acetamido-2-deoxy-ribo-hexuluronate aminotransferase